MIPRPRLSGTGLRIAVEAHAVVTLTRAGMLGPVSPANLSRISKGLNAYGVLGGAISMAAIRFGDKPALIDERGTLSFRELDERSDAIAIALRDLGVVGGARIGILCRNHRGMLESTFAAAKLGAKALYLNTDFSKPQATEVCAREGIDLLIHDEEFADVLSAVETPMGRFLAWVDEPGEASTLDGLIEAGLGREIVLPSKPGSLVMLTSGTTGTPKGAPREQPRSLALPAGLLSKIPYRNTSPIYVAPPMFHGWGLLNATVALGMGATMVTHRRFVAETVLESIVEHRIGGLAVVPVMLKRLLALGEEGLAAYDLSSLKIIAAAGAQLEGPLATQAMDVFGDILYNLYGSTECAYASIATPEDLRAAPGCVGKSPFGTTVSLFDDVGHAVPQGAVGHIFVANTSQFGGYTGGGHKELIAGMMSTGDVGHFDEGGRLFVDGRDDDMIVSGGENVFPQEVEELLAAHPDIADCAVIGVADESFGQVLRAFVVARPASILDEKTIQNHVRDNLARYKVPRAVIFLDELPRNPSGKVLKRELAARD